MEKHQDTAHAEEDQQQHQQQQQQKEVAVVAAACALPPQQQQQVLVQQQQQQEEQDPAFSADDLHGNDTRILALLNEEEGSNYSFKGIQRRLGIHQQSLARALHRLKDMGLVERSGIGYHLSKVGAGAAAAAGQRGAPNKRGEYIQLLQTYIPVSVRPAEVARPLVGRWFRGLRWVGLIESATGFTLQWAGSDSSFQINLRMISDYVIVETNASSEQEKLQAMAGSYAIFEQITKVLQDKFSSSSRGPANAYVLGGGTYGHPPTQANN